MKSKSNPLRAFDFRAFLQKHSISPMAVLLFGVLLLCFICICYLNVSVTPHFYNTDMYLDILYAEKAWEAKSLFPDGWVFGNQYYVIATPALAALIYGIIGHPALAMAIASILMTVGIFLSYLWMLKPVFPKIEERLTGLICLVVLTAYCSDAIYYSQGWQLFFTMCSYYACYLITAFLCFGCFLRRREAPTRTMLAVFFISFVMSFATGMQSLRQTAVMLFPMLAVEGIEQILCIIRTKKADWQALLMTGALSAANLTGLAAIRLMNIPHNEVFSSAELLSKEKIPESINQSLDHLMGLLTDKTHYGVLFLFAIALLILAIAQTKHKKSHSSAGWASLIALFSLSVAVIFAIDVCTQMSVRNIYYFMLFPLLSLLPIYAYRHWHLGKALALILVAALAAGAFTNAILPAARTARNADSDISYEISDMLTEKGYTTIYSGWNQCEDIAIASNGALQAGFWNYSNDVYHPVTYLCDPSVYAEDCTKSVFYLRKDNHDLAIQRAKEAGVTMTLIAEYPQQGIWLYEASENLMTLFYE